MCEWLPVVPDDGEHKRAHTMYTVITVSHMMNSTVGKLYESVRRVEVSTTSHCVGIDIFPADCVGLRGAIEFADCVGLRGEIESRRFLVHVRGLRFGLYVRLHLLVSRFQNSRLGFVSQHFLKAAHPLIYEHYATLS